jgi:tetratricopeptide (TPR) repeat protein
VHEAFTLLGELGHRIGSLDAIDLSPRGLVKWERSSEWRSYPSVDQAVLLTRAYLTMGRILASNGRYSDALSVFQRGLAHANDPRAPDLARCATSPLRLARAQALLEFGALDDAEEVLAQFAAEPEDRLAPALRTQRLELAGKLDLLRGRLGRATVSFQSVMQFCAVGGFARAQAAAALNLAHIFVLLNRVEEALDLVQRSAEAAVRLADAGMGLRAAAIGSLALARTGRVSRAFGERDTAYPWRACRAIRTTSDARPTGDSTGR